ncbi:MAG: hypothetical protein HY736_14380 [Verrucomicrobia bacterium]|nr:hypothetical protein [Verrucomicrobiota bacterium]
MGEENFVIWLDERTYITVEFLTLRGSVVSFIVRLMRKDSRGDSILSRFDTAHGTPHQDLLTPSGNLKRKEWMLDASLNEALTRAIRHFKAHHEDYQG